MEASGSHIFSALCPLQELGHPHSGQAYVDLGDKSQTEGRPDEAIFSYKRALVINPHDLRAWYNLGLAYIEIEEYERAIECLRKVLGAKPDFFEARHNLCVCLQESGMLEEAEMCYLDLSAKYPDLQETRFNLSCLRLLRGNFGSGLPEYEKRFFRKESAPDRSFHRPRWDGSPLHGATILLHAEQGFGDTLQMVRYVPLVEARGGRVVLEVPAALARLLGGVKGVDRIVRMGEPLPDFDVHLPMMSLPYVFNTTLETVPSRVPYISPETELTDSWQRRLTGDQYLRVGIVWSGRMDHRINRKRSCNHASLAPLGKITGASFYSLQVDGNNAHAGEEMPALGMRDVAREFADFADTAACIANLDLVITIDTSVAHLAGALGKPVWVMIPMVPDWRWLLGREDSPWYPTMRLFRQERRRDWDEVISRVAVELEKAASEKADKRIDATRACHAEKVARNNGQIELLCRELSICPDDLDLYLRTGHSLHELERYGEAVAVYDRALALKPDFGAAYHNRGNALMEMGRYKEAIESYRAALRFIPSFAEGYVTIATALMALRKPYEAMASCHRALAIDISCAEAHWNLALALLQIGEYESGWEEFEWRWKKRGFTSRLRTFLQPQWDGGPLQGKTVLIHAEQGFGDTFQFARYLPLLAEQGGTVVLECPPSQKTLLERVTGVTRVIEAEEPLPDFDFHLPIMSLPRVFQTRLDTIPVSVPYIFPPLEALALWTEKFTELDSLRIGLVWAGRKRPDPNRTCPFHNFSPLAGIPGVTFYSLQLENEMSARGNSGSGLELIDHTADINDFRDTAALIAHMDLVISIDTGVAHLSGAMGKETWVLLPYAADWRWMLDRNDSPWYPGMQLFRQESPGDWPDVIDRVKQCLKQKIAGRSKEGTNVAPMIEKHYSDGLSQIRAGNIGAAETSILKVLLLNPRIPEVMNALGIISRNKEARAEAFRFFRHAVNVDPGYVDGAINFGNALYGADRLEESIAEYLRALRQAPDDARIYQNLGVAFQALGKIDEAAAAFSTALRLDPGYGTARWNLAVLKLLVGNFVEGFAGFESRFCKNEPVPMLHGDRPSWDGTPFAGRTLLVHAEQGFGDTFQFARYLPMVARLGGKVLFECQDRTLREVLQNSFYDVDVFVRGEMLPHFDAQVPLLSLPRISRTTETTIPSHVPYIVPTAEKRDAWSKLVEGDKGLRIGLVWAGRKLPDPKRSASLASMAPLAEFPDAIFYSLQIGPGSEEAMTPPVGMKLIDSSGELTDFSETAALIANLDLVITIDSAVAHLSGAMGKETWVLLPYAADWRWMLNRSDSPWFPTMRLFRQDRPGDWSGVMLKVLGYLFDKFPRPVETTLGRHRN